MKLRKIYWIIPFVLILFAKDLVLTKSFSCQLRALTYLARNFGQQGEAGTDGADGAKGTNGRDRTIFADDKYIELDLSGRDGRDGRDGRNGLDAICTDEPNDYPNENITAPNGGRGGHAGSGGDGGDGGNLIVYYSDLASLKNIYINATGGRGGQPGYAGYGGQGCLCSLQSWSNTVCTGTPGFSNYQCSEKTFYCTDGQQGEDGQDGRAGRDGNLGSLRLLKRTTELPPDRPTANLSLSRLQNQITGLSLNVWQTKSGANLLLASGSQIQDNYQEFVTRLEKDFELIWQAPQPLTGVGDENITVTLDRNSFIRVVSPEDVWLQGSLSELDNKTQYTVTAVVRRSEATKLTRADFKGNKSDLQFALIDRANKSEILDTQFEIEYRSGRSGYFFEESKNTYRTRYKGAIPSDLVTRNRNRFVLNLGQLPIKERFLRTGVPVDLKLTITRSLGENSAQQVIQWKGVIK